MGEPPGNTAEALVMFLLQLPDSPAMSAEEVRYIVQKIYDGYYVFECLTDRDWNEAVCGICGICPIFESADGNCKNCVSLTQSKVSILWMEVYNYS